MEIIFSLSAIAISLFSLYLSYTMWCQSNRPIVTAFITEDTKNRNTFNLIISNSGIRPATNVHITASEDEINMLTQIEASEARKKSIKDCFSDDATIPVLRNGEELETAFGAFGGDDIWLNYGVQIPIEVHYSDLEGKSYMAKMPLKIYARQGFGGSLWQKQLS